ncbi:MAG TPA: hypothetical protein VJR89_12710 [Polyangiales bacterium]|nr:hypothetical protein [Polyangiales bacterium]
MLSSACYTYAYHQRQVLTPNDRIAVDRQTPVSEVQWSYAWGSVQSEWTPPAAACDGKPAGRVETHFVWYSVPMLVATLGFALPAETTYYCCTDEAPAEGP